MSKSYSEKDFVTVVDEDGVVQPEKIPAAWIGTDLAPGVKKATRKQRDSQESPGDTGDAGGSGSTPPDPNVEPKGNASREDWAAYAATVKGASAGDLVDSDGEPLSRDAIREKYGTPADS